MWLIDSRPIFKPCDYPLVIFWAFLCDCKHSNVLVNVLIELVFKKFLNTTDGIKVNFDWAENMFSLYFIDVYVMVALISREKETINRFSSWYDCKNVVCCLWQQ